MPANDEERARDLRLMQECLDLAKQAQGRTAPNPLVGSIVLDADGQVVGKGFHPRAGQKHAEIFALQEAGQRACGGSLYVTLEPCSHYGRTPPCLKAVLESGVARVLIGTEDPNPQVAGTSIRALSAAGIEVSVGLLAEECLWLNRGFFKRMRQGLPWITLKLAVTLDGKIADRTGSSRWISGEPARRYEHTLRGV